MSNKPHRTFGSDDAIKYSLCRWWFACEKKVPYQHT
jgi:hypothetical protein